MGSLTDHTSLIQNQDPVRMQDRADTLCNDQSCSIFCLFFQCTAEHHICLIVKSRKTVIKNIDLRPFCNSPGNGETLFLPAGYIGTSLGYLRIHLLLFFLYEVPCLSHFSRPLNFCVCCVLFSVADIGVNSS